MKSEFPPVHIDERDFSTQFLEKIWFHASENPNKPALINAHNPEDRVTFRDIYIYIRSLAAFLHQHGFGEKDVAGIVSHNCWEYVVAFGASILCGGAFSGASYLFTEIEIQRQLLDNGASVVFCSEQLLDRVQTAIAKCPNVKVYATLFYF